MSLPWVVDGIDQPESNVLVSLAGLSRPMDTEKIWRILDLPWIGDGISKDEDRGAQALADIWWVNREAGEFFIDLSWVADGLTLQESQSLSRVFETLYGTPGFTEHILAHWRDHGYSETLFWYVSFILPSGEELAKDVVRLPWVGDGLTQAEANFFNKLTGNPPVDTAMGRRILNLPWVADGLTEVESSGATHLMDAWRSDEKLGQFLIDLPWVADGISGSEENGLWGISGMSYTDARLAWEVIDSMEVMLSLEGDLAANGLAALGQLGEFPEDLWPMVEQPWFADGLNREETAFITTLVPLVYDSPSTYGALLESRFTLSRDISLPRKEGAKAWALQNEPFSSHDDILTVVEEMARAAEEFMGAPFPAKDIILLFVVPDDQTGSIGIAHHMGSHVRVTNRGAGRFEDNPDLLRHELAHYYFHLGFAPVWLREGAADYFVSYMRERSGGQSLDRQREVVARAAEGCVSTVAGNIGELNRIYDPIRDTPGCAYTMGENFLHEAREVLGEDRLSAVLRELYYLSLDRGTLLPGSEEEIFDIFLINTPVGQEEEFRSLYRRLHGG